MRISDWSSDVCSSDLLGLSGPQLAQYLKTKRLATRQAAGLEQQQGRHFAGSWIERKANGDFHFVVASTPIAPQTEAAGRSEERRVGKECGSTWRSRWSPNI